MKKILPFMAAVTVSVSGVIGVGALLSVKALAQQATDEQGISGVALQQIADIATIKQSFTPAQQKIDSSLVFAAKAASGELAGSSVADIASMPSVDLGSNVSVEIYGAVTSELLASIASANGVVLARSEPLEVIRASLPLGAIDTVAAHDDVQSIQSAPQALTNVGSLTSQGYVTHSANQVFRMGIDGTGVTVGVLSDSALPARVAALIASGAAA